MKTQSDQAIGRTAERVDPDGVTERIELRGSDGQRMFTVLHIPATPPRAAVLICSPLHGEFMRNYRREVLLARRLASLGFTVERFHYRYSGNSDGDDVDLTYESMTEDAVDCIEHLKAETGSSDLFVVGTRWGGLIAASGAARCPGAGAVLWAPLVDAAGFFKEAFRSRLVAEHKDAAARPVSRDELEARLRDGQSVEGAAHSLEARLFQTSAGRSLEGELGTTQRSVLLMPIGSTATLRPDLAALADRWRDGGLEVEARVVRGEESWWLINDRWHNESTRPMTRELIKHTAAWLLARTNPQEQR
jgi:alpha/beta superfamily hydrolase